MKDSLIGNHMIKYPHIVAPELSIAAAMEKMRSLGIRHLPVFSEGKLVGLVSERDLKAAHALPKSETLFVSDVMKTDVFVASPETPLSEVANEMAESRLGSAIIVDRTGMIAGIFTTTDALRLLAGLAEEGTVDEFLLEFESYEDMNPSHLGL